MDDNPTPLPWETEDYRKHNSLLFEPKKRHSVKDVQELLKGWAKEEHDRVKEITDLLV